MKVRLTSDTRAVQRLSRGEKGLIMWVYWWQCLCLKAAPTTSPFSSGWWTHSPSLLPYASWDQPLTWSSERASMLTLGGGSTCRGCTTGIMYGFALSGWNWKWHSGGVCSAGLLSALFLALWQPKSSVVGLLTEMTAKFEEDPPLSAKATADNKDPHELLAFVSNLQINDGMSLDVQLCLLMINNQITGCYCELNSCLFQVEPNTMINRSTKSQLSGEEI